MFITKMEKQNESTIAYGTLGQNINFVTIYRKLFFGIVFV